MKPSPPSKQIASLLNQALVWHEQDKLHEALWMYQQVLKIDQSNFTALQGMGILNGQFGRFEEALKFITAAVMVRPNDFAINYNQGVALQELKRHAEALSSYDKVLTLNPNLAEAHVNRGNALQELKRYEEALVSYDNALALQPDNAKAYKNKGIIKILLGDFEGGWPLFEWRWKDDQKDAVRNFKQPLWLGEQSISGKTILLHAEQGLGDTLQMIRYVPMVAALGAKVILEAPAVLVPLLNTIKNETTIVTKGDALPGFDCHCPLMSLPLAFKTRVDSVPAPIPYLTAELQKLNAWRERLGAKTRPRVGLAWSGNPQHKNDRNRSIGLRMLEPLRHLACEYHSLQKEVRIEDQPAMAEYTQIQAHENELTDFSDTAALIAELDLIITIDSSVAHLAGALGKSVWILLPYNSDYRWLTARNDSPWYPTARLFRQRSIGDWDGVIKEISSILNRQFNYPTPVEKPVESIS